LVDGCTASLQYMAYIHKKPVNFQKSFTQVHLF